MLPAFGGIHWDVDFSHMGTCNADDLVFGADDYLPFHYLDG